MGKCRELVMGITRPDKSTIQGPICQPFCQLCQKSPVYRVNGLRVRSTHGGLVLLLHIVKTTPSALDPWMTTAIIPINSPFGRRPIIRKVE